MIQTTSQACQQVPSLSCAAPRHEIISQTALVAVQPSDRRWWPAADPHHTGMLKASAGLALISLGLDVVIGGAVSPQLGQFCCLPADAEGDVG